MNIDMWLWVIEFLLQYMQEIGALMVHSFKSPISFHKIKAQWICIIMNSKNIPCQYCLLMYWYWNIWHLSNVHNVMDLWSGHIIIIYIYILSDTNKAVCLYHLKLGCNYVNKTCKGSSTCSTLVHISAFHLVHLVLIPISFPVHSHSHLTFHEDYYYYYQNYDYYDSNNDANDIHLWILLRINSLNFVLYLANSAVNIADGHLERSPMWSANRVFA